VGVEGSVTVGFKASVETIDFVEDAPNEPEGLGVVGAIGDIFVGDADRSNGFDLNWWAVGSYAFDVGLCAIGVASGVGLPLCAFLIKNMATDIWKFVALEGIDLAEGEGWIEPATADELDFWVPIGIDLISIFAGGDPLKGITAAKTVVNVVRNARLAKKIGDLTLIAGKIWDRYTRDIDFKVGVVVQVNVEFTKKAVRREIDEDTRAAKAQPYRQIAPRVIRPAY
jgi:hypothetical protein